jgi:hypothetical protein
MIKKYIVYILAAAYFGALFNLIIRNFIEPWWLSIMLSIITSMLLGMFVAQLVVLHEKYNNLRTKFVTKEYLDQIDSRGEKVLQKHFEDRIYNKMDKLNTQLREMSIKKHV